MSLEVIGLSKSFGGIKALSEVSFHVPRGCFQVIVGPSGCGKTTLLRCIAGVETPDAGEVTINGKLVFSKDKVNIPPEKRHVGMVYQSYALWPHMTVFDNVAFPLRVRGEPQQKIGEAVRNVLKLLNVEELASRYPSALSGGQQQRVALARALVYEPPILLLDEPLSGLDEPLRIEVARDLKAVHRQTGTDIIYVTHNRDEALWLGDQILLLLGGKISALGSRESLLKRPPNIHAAKYLTEMVLFEGEVVNSKDGVNEVATRIGLIKCLNNSKHTNGERVHVGINERRITPSTSSSETNIFEGTVVEEGIIQNDGRYMYEIEIQSEKVTVLLDDGGIARGSKLQVRFPPEYCVVIADEH